MKRFRKDQRGVAAMEFAIAAPIMMLLYYGAAELTVGVMASGRANHVASIVGDLVSQTQSVKSSDMTDIFAVGSAIMKPFPTSSLQMRVTSVKADAQAVPKVIWSRAQGMAQLDTGSISGFPSGLLVAGDSVVMAEVQYTYDSPIRQTIPQPLTFHGKYYIKPRRSSEVTWDPS